MVFQPGKVPAYVDTLDQDDEWKISRLLPRLNTHHKQFFFASRPIFVEGYFDQQLFTLIQEKREVLLGASGTSIIDVSGKDELDLFFRLCKKLDINAQFIADLDVLIRGRLRQSISHDDRCKAYLRGEGLGEDLMAPLGEMERWINDCLTTIEPKLGSEPSIDSSLQPFVEALNKVSAEEETGDRLKAKQYVFLLGLRRMRAQIESLIPGASW